MQLHVSAAVRACDTVACCLSEHEWPRSILMGNDSTGMPMFLLHAQHYSQIF